MKKPVHIRSSLARSVERFWFEQLESRRMLASVASVSPYNGQQSVATGSNVLVTFGEPMNPSTLTAERVLLRDDNGNNVAAALNYNATSRVLTVDPSANLVAGNGYYTLRVVGGANGVKASDGSALPADTLVSFTCGKPALTQQTVFSGLNKPVNVEFAADGRVYVAEQSGLIKLFDNLSDTTPTVAADFRTNVHHFWDRGLLGMALDPQFTSGRPYVYVLYTYDALIGGTAPRWGTVNGTDDGGGNDPNGVGATVSARLSRFTVGANGTISGGEQVLINDWAQQFPSHSIGDMKFGPDGYLYASAGDGASFNVVDYGQLGNPFGDPANQGGALRSQDTLSDGDPTSLDGTIIRVDPNTGAAAPGNPFASSADANKRRIIATGLRNPFRITFKPGTRELYIADTGWNTWEEINRISDVSDTFAENFGWPAYEGPNRQSGYDAQNLPLLEAFYATPGAHTGPWFAYQHSERIVPGSTERTGGSSPTGLAFYQGGSYPIAYDGALFFADYSRAQVYVMHQGTDGQLNQASRQLVGTGGIVELTVGPGGDIFGVNMSAGWIVRFTAVATTNRAPVARITADKTSGALPLTVNFNGSQSSDPDGASLWLEWDLDGDELYDDATGPAATWTYTTAGEVAVGLRVWDPTGLSATSTVLITAAGTPNRAPVPTIDAPLASVRWKVGDTLGFSGSATDPEDGTLAAARLTWDLFLIHGNEIDPTNSHQHRITGFNGVASGSFVTPDHEYPSWLELRLTATDSRGLTGTTTLRIDPRTVILSFQTSPSGLKIAFNGTEYTGPFSRRVIAGSANSVSAISPQTLGASTYAFNGWSQGGNASQTMTAPGGDGSYTATFASTTLIKLSGTVIGTAGSYGDLGNTRDKAFDGSLATFFDAPTAAAWVGLDLGTGRTIAQIRFAPRDGNAARMVGGRFQGSNDASFTSGVTDLYTIGAAPAVGAFTSVAVSSPASFRYVRYLAPATAYGNVAEIEFYTAQTGSLPAAPTGLAASPTPAGIALAWADASNNETAFLIQRAPAGTGAWTEIATVAAGQTTYTDAAVIALARYDYRVAARNGVGDSGFSNVATATAAGATITPPAAPGTLLATAVGSGQVNLSWVDGSNNESEFIIERRVGTAGTWVQAGSAGANVTSFSDAGLSAATQYQYRVYATNSAGASGYSNVSSATTAAASGVPSAPTSPNATVLAGPQVRFAWTDTSKNETAFVVQRRYAGWIWGDLPITVAANATSITDTSAIGGVVYEYRVAARNASGTSAWSDGVTVDTSNVGPGPQAPAAPSGLIATVATGTRVDLTWDDNSTNETGFRVERRLAGGTFALVTTTAANARSFSDTGVVPGASYEYRVLATDGTLTSPPSNTAAVATPGGAGIPAAPSLFTAVVLPNRTVSMSWRDNSNNETGFRIQRRYRGWIWEDLITLGANATSYTDAGVYAGVAYEYRVVAIGGGGASAPSNGVEVSVT